MNYIMKQVDPYFSKDELSKSAICFAGNTYEYDLKLEKDRDYRISFFASSVFNNQVNFRMINTLNSKELINLPGTSSDIYQRPILEEYSDNSPKKRTHPYCTVKTKTNAEVKIIIGISPLDELMSNGYSDFQAYSNPTKGCVTIFVQSKPSE